MFRIQEIESELLHLIGWKQNEDTSEFAIADSLLISESGLIFQQAHPLLTLQNIKSVAPNFDSIVYPDYSELTLYRIGDKCTYLNVQYRAKVENSNILPTSSSTWERCNPFSEWLEQKMKFSISKALLKFVNERLSVGSAKKVVENKILFDGAGNINDTYNFRSGIVGFEIVVGRFRNLTVKIEKIGLQFTKAETISLFVMHSSKPDSVYNIKLTKTKANSFEWFKDINISLPYLGSETDAGGSWFICYALDLIENEECLPIVKSKDWSSTPCEGCDSSYAGYKTLSRFVEVYPFKTSFTRSVSGEVDVLDMWDISNSLHTPLNNYGMNLELSVVCDMTDFILTQRSSFANLIMTQFAVDMIKEMCYNPNARVNRNALLAQRSELLYALEGDTTSFKKSGLVNDLDVAFRSINVDLNGIDKVCLPCKNKGIKYRTV